MRNSIWDLLGISATADVAAIRRAYAVKLKSIDVDAEPERFIALRAAYDEARGGAGAPPPLDRSADRTVSTPFPPPRVSEEMEAIAALISSNKPRRAISAELAGRTTRLAAQARSRSIDEAEWVETWLSETIVAGLPRTDAMLDVAAVAFGWTERATYYDCPEPVLLILQRRESLAAVESMACINPAYRHAWEALTEQDVDLAAVHTGCMTTLLGTLRYRHPDLLEHIDIKQFERWATHLERVRKAERMADTTPRFDKEPPAAPLPFRLNSAINAAIAAIGIGVIGYGGVLLLKYGGAMLDRFAICAFVAWLIFKLAHDRQTDLKRQRLIRRSRR